MHLVAHEDPEKVSIVGCANAQVIPPMIFFKGKRLTPIFEDGLPLPPGATVNGKRYLVIAHFKRHFKSFIMPFDFLKSVY